MNKILATIMGWLGVWPKPFKRYAWAVKDMIGYGCINAWWKPDPWKMARLCADNGVNVIHIAMLGWHGYPNMWKRPDDIEKPYKKLLAACRHYKIILFAEVANDNAGQSKHEWPYPGEGMQQMSDAARIALQIVVDNKPDGVIVQSVGETQTSAGKAFETGANVQLGSFGFKRCWNRGSRPSGSNGLEYFAYHPNATNTTGPDGCIIVTDTSGILRALQNGDVYAPKANPEAVREYAQRVHNDGRGFVMYGFKHPDVDEATVKALRKVRR